MAKHYPKRIVSVVPSQTELLYDLGLGDRVVGISKFCVHPFEWFRSKEKVGGTKTILITNLRKLKPDLVIANKEENEREQIEEIAQFCPVHTTDVKNVQDALAMITEVGEITGTQTAAANLRARIEQHLAEVKVEGPLKRAAYLIWRNPYMVAGGDTFVNDMLKHAGYTNIFSDMTRYPSLSAAELAEANPECILLSSEPYPFKEKHAEELAEICPNATIRMVDGELYSWYGSRLLHFQP